MPVKRDAEHVVRLSDIANIQRTFKDPQSLAKVNGYRTISIEISKRVGENIIETIEEVKKITSIHQEFGPPM